MTTASPTNAGGTSVTSAKRNGTLVQGEEKKQMVRSMFDTVAPRYDVVNKIISGGLDISWRRRSFNALCLPAGSRILDLACGTGDFCRLLLSRGMKAVGLDMSSGMLGMARCESPLVLGDALELPFSEGSFDGVVCGFGLRNFADIPSVATELARVVRPGGRIALLEVSIPSSAIARAGYQAWFEHAVPAIGGLLSDPAAYRYLPDSVEYLPTPERLRAMLREAGFRGVGRRTFTAGATQLYTGTRAGTPPLPDPGERTTT
jgi:demethylmenaquinone methyltransferase/2-methoxy-6-polyprenyl-1,4-benzoquinol methylase